MSEFSPFAPVKKFEVRLLYMLQWLPMWLTLYSTILIFLDSQNENSSNQKLLYGNSTGFYLYALLPHILL